MISLVSWIKSSVPDGGGQGTLHQLPAAQLSVVQHRVLEARTPLTRTCHDDSFRGRKTLEAHDNSIQHFESLGETGARPKPLKRLLEPEV